MGNYLEGGVGTGMREEDGGQWLCCQSCSVRACSPTSTPTLVSHNRPTKETNESEKRGKKEQRGPVSPSPKSLFRLLKWGVGINRGPRVYIAKHPRPTCGPPWSLVHSGLMRYLEMCTTCFLVKLLLWLTDTRLSTFSFSQNGSPEEIPISRGPPFR